MIAKDVMSQMHRFAPNRCAETKNQGRRSKGAATRVGLPRPAASIERYWPASARFLADGLLSHTGEHTRHSRPAIQPPPTYTID